MSRLTLYQQAADPAAPSAGAVHFYAKTDDKLYWREDDGDVHKLAHSGEAEAFLTLTVTGNISASNPSSVLTLTSTTAANSAYIDFISNGLHGYIGKVGTAGGELITGGTAGALAIANGTNLPVQIGVNGVLIGSFTSAGLTLIGALNIDGTGSALRAGTVGTGASNNIVIDGAATGSPYLQFNQNGVNRGYVQYDNTAAGLVFGISSEAARITNSKYFKASNSGAYVNTAGNYHEFRNNVVGAAVLYLSHSHATDPNGLIVEHTAAAANDTTTGFAYFSDTVGLKVGLRRNGGIANFSANNVNLSDANEKLSLPMPSFIDEWERIDWKRYFLKDQTHTDFNYGYTAQNIADVFASKAPELVTVFDKDRLGVHEADLHNIGGAVLTELLRKFKALEAACAAAGITVQ